MPSSITHAVAAVALGRVYTSRPLPMRFWILSAFCAIAPDFDVVGKRFGIEYTDLFGHRGFTHSFLFAALLSGLITLLAFRTPPDGISRLSLSAFFFLATSSHALLDAMVDGTLGVALLAPFDSTRYFLPFRPIVSSPVGWDFFSYAGVTVIANEFIWLWIPSTMAILIAWLRQTLAGRRSPQKP